MPDYELTQEQINAIEDVLARRMKNTGETRAQASEHISSLLLARLSKIETQPSDNDGRADTGTTERCACCSDSLHAEEYLN
jgi:hypothetical protein